MEWNESMAQVLASGPTRTVTSSRDAVQYFGVIITIASGLAQIVVGGAVSEAIQDD